MALTITRLNPEKEKSMRQDILVSKHRYYVTADKTRAVKSGDPAAAVLLVGKGAALAPEVAEFYGLETEGGESVIKVDPLDEAVKSAMQTEGTTAENYERMKLNKKVYDSAVNSVSNPHYPNASQQASIMAAGAVNQEFGARDPNNGNPLDEKAERMDNASNGLAPSMEQDFTAQTGEVASVQNVKTKTVGNSKPTPPPVEKVSIDDTTKTEDEMARILKGK